MGENRPGVIIQPTPASFEMSASCRRDRVSIAPAIPGKQPATQELAPFPFSESTFEGLCCLHPSSQSGSRYDPQSRIHEGDRGCSLTPRTGDRKEPTSSDLIPRSRRPGCTSSLFLTHPTPATDSSPLSESVEDPPKAERVDSEFLLPLLYLRRQQYQEGIKGGKSTLQVFSGC